MTRRLAIPALAALLATASQAQDNLLTNPGFESGKTGWTLYVNSSATTETGTREAVSSAVAGAARLAG